MKKYKYHPMLNAGSVAAGATLGVPDPAQHRAGRVRPVYGPIHRKALFRQCHSQRDPHGAHRRDGVLHLLSAIRIGVRARPKSTWSERMRALPEIIDILILFAIIMYALFTGVVTATEAAAASCALGLAHLHRSGESSAGKASWPPSGTPFGSPAWSS